MDNVSAYQAISDPNRRRLMDALMQDGPLRAGDLAGRLAHISRPAVSKHLRVLRNSELVTQTQQGRERWYQLNPEPLLQVLKWVAQYEIFWEEKLLKLKEIVEEDGN